MVAEQRETLGVFFCRTCYGASNENTQGRCSRSKAITAAKGRKIVTLLKSDRVAELLLQVQALGQAEGFDLISHQALGLANVLCLPTKKKVRHFNVLLLQQHINPCFDMFMYRTQMIQ